MKSFDSSTAVVLLTVFVVLASGCASDTSSPGADTDIPSSEQDPVTSDKKSEGVETVGVTEVVDGDTIDISYNGEQTVRLLGVDTPEVHVDVQPDEWEGIPDNDKGTECLSRYAEQASEFMKERLGEEAVFEDDPVSDRRGYYGRLLGYMYRVEDGSKEEKSLNLQLLEKGLAKVYDSEFSREDKFYSAEEEAMENNRGVWSCRSGGQEEQNNQGTTENTTEQDTQVSGSSNKDVSLPVAVSDSRPCQYSEVTVSGRILNSSEGVEDVNVSSSWSYSSTSSTESGVSGSDGSFSLTRDIGRASTSYEVDVRVSASVNGVSVSNSTAFTPKSC